MRSLASLLTALLLAACGAPAAPSGSQGPGSGRQAAPNAQAAGASATTAAARALPDGISALVDAARREGRVVTYGVTSTPADEDAMRRAFRDFYGFDLELSFESGLHPQKVAELLAAARSGVRSGIDLFWSSELILNDLDHGGLLQDGTWLEPLGLSSENLMMHGKGARVHDSFLVNVLYNTQQVSATDAPHRYQDLLQPRWQGAIVAPRTPSQMVFLTFLYGEDAVTELAQGLVRQRIAFVPTYPDATGRVASGEYLLGMGQNAEREARRGAPLADAPLDVAIVVPWAVSLMTDAEHPAAATLLAYFLTQPEGQRAIDQTWANSLASSPDTSAWRVAQGKQLVQPTLDWLERDEARLRAKYADILGIR
ncbi:MAG TPA: ABC transporter substrate-binding protein [Chloroflexota bacterium]|nr:ABC transporter substrate-binding protein [Chloroflexota bacterium]